LLRRDWLRRELDTLGVFVLARNDAQSTFYLLIGFIALYAGEYTLLVALYAVALMASIALAYGEMGSHFPETGGSYLYVKYSLGPLVGYISAWLLALDQIIMVSYGTLDASIYLLSLLDRLGVEVAIPASLVALMLSSALFVVTLSGIRESARLAMAVAFFDIAVVFTLLLLANALGGLSFELPSFEWSGVGYTSLLMAFALASRGFTGIDSIGQLAGEARSPLIQIPRATILLVAAMGVVSLTLTVLLMGRVPYEYIGAKPELALLLVAENTPFIGSIAVILVALNLILIMLTAALAGYVAFSRLVYMLAEEGHLPRVLASVHGKFRTPHVALLVVYIVSALFIIPGELKLIVEVYAIASLANYLLVSISLAVLERRGRLHGGFRSPRIKGIPVTAVACATLTSIGIVLSLVERLHAVWILGVWAFLGLALLYARRLYMR